MKRKRADCWCRCICHTPMIPADAGAVGTMSCHNPTRAGKCGECRRRCNPNSKPADR